MRDILFRGRVKYPHHDMNGKFILGYLVVRPIRDEEPAKHFICEDGYKFIQCLNKMIRTYEVDPDTVGQYTGLIDKNGKLIFEGDIVTARIEDVRSNHDGFEWPGMRVEFSDGSFYLLDNIGRKFAALSSFAPYVTFEVVGNIYEDDVMEDIN